MPSLFKYIPPEASSRRPTAEELFSNVNRVTDGRRSRGYRRRIGAGPQKGELHER